MPAGAAGGVLPEPELEVLLPGLAGVALLPNGTDCLPPNGLPLPEVLPGAGFFAGGMIQAYGNQAPETGGTGGVAGTSAAAVAVSVSSFDLNSARAARVVGDRPASLARAVASAW